MRAGAFLAPARNIADVVLVIRLVLRDDLRRNSPAVADIQARTLGPGPDFGAAPAMRGRPALRPAHPAGDPARLIGEPPHGFIELLAVLLAQVDLVIPAVEAERAGEMLPVRNFPCVVVTVKW